MAGGSPKDRPRKRKPGARAKAGAAPRARPVPGSEHVTHGDAPVPPTEPAEPAAAPPPPPPPAAPAAAAPPRPPPSRPTVAEATATATARIAAFERHAEATLAALEHRLQELAGRAGLGAAREELGEVLARLLPALAGRLSALMDLIRLVEPPERMDRFGMDARLVERARPLLEFLYASWWRVEVRSIERVPAQGPALVVANHAGRVPWDALVLRHAFHRDHPAHRDLRPLLDDGECDLPVFGGFAVRAGAVRASPENVDALLREGTLVGVFPEGSAAATKPWRDRYRIQQFGRGGFAKLALRAGAPIVPCAIVGSEEAAPPIARTGWLAERLGLSLWPGSALLALGPAAFVPLPSRWTIRFGEPIAAEGGAAAANDPAAVLALTAHVRGAIQAMLDEDVAGRRSVFL